MCKNSAIVKGVNGFQWRALLVSVLLLGAYACNHQNNESIVDNWEPDHGLLSVEALDSLLRVGENHLRLIEVSQASDYAAGHLPGALNLWRPDYESHAGYPYGGMMAARDSMAALLSELGITSEDRLVIYDVKGCADAARLRWILRQYGHQRVYLLDGEKHAWTQAGLPMDTTSAAPNVPSRYLFPGAEREGALAHFSDVIRAITDTNYIILDVREDYEFTGLPFRSGQQIHYFKAGAAGAGSIPGAIHLNWSDAVNLGGDHRFKTREELRQLYAEMGVRPDKDIIVYCQSGVRSANTTFVLSELLDYPSVHNYDGSWIEWSFYHKNGFYFPIDRHSDSTAIAMTYRALGEQ